MEEDNYTRITLRIPKALHEELQAAADSSSKSMNAEIIARIKQTFATTASMSTPVIVQNFDDLMTEFMRRYNITMESPAPVTPPKASGHTNTGIEQLTRRVKLRGKIK